MRLHEKRGRPDSRHEKEEIDYCEAEYVDFQYEYLQMHKPEG
jgi:hypothetical protein